MFLVIEAMRKAVPAATGRPASRSAIPTVVTWASAPACTMPAAMPGIWYSAAKAATAESIVS